MNQLRELIYDIDSHRKFMISFSAPEKGCCYECIRENDRIKNYKLNKKEIEQIGARQVGISFWRNFKYVMKYPDKEKYEERVVPIITPWNICCRAGYLILCPNEHPWLGTVGNFFWQSSDIGSDYLQLDEVELNKFLPRIKKDIEDIIKNEPDFEEIEVKRESN